MTTMPPTPSYARCVFYTSDNTDLGLSDAVKLWFVSMRRPTAHGTITIPGREGGVYHLGTLADESRGQDWPIEVHDWLRDRGNMPDALVVVWKTNK